MKVAVVYNRESNSVINLFGMPNREKIGLKTVKRIADALKAGKHQVATFEGDMHLVERLGEFMPRVVKGERPGLVFNLSYGIQGQARYTHIPSILEMVGIPYVASGPLAHSLCLDKVVTKMLLRDSGLPTPDFAVLPTPDAPMPDLPFPLIVKPKNEAVSFGLKIVHDDAELREAAAVIFDRFQQPVLVESYIEGREINVGLLGNSPPEALPPAEIVFGGEGPPIYTYEDKTRRSGREIGVRCPAELPEALATRAQEIAREAFVVLGCADCARVDMRLDANDQLYILEVNSLPSMGEHGSYVEAARQVGLDFPALVNRLVEVASARYFGTPQALHLAPEAGDPAARVVGYVTSQRDRMERRLRNWVALSSRTGDAIGIQGAYQRQDATMQELGLRAVPDLTDGRFAWTWESAAGLHGGTLFLVPLDVPLPRDATPHAYRRDPERLYGEGIGCSRAPLVMLEYVLRSLRRLGRLRKTRLGVLAFADEGLDNRYTAEVVRTASTRADRVFGLRPGNVGDRAITQRRGQRRYVLRVEGKPRRIGRGDGRSQLLHWTLGKLEDLGSLTSRKERVAVAVTDVSTHAWPMLLPHRLRCEVVLSYPDAAAADAMEARMREVLEPARFPWTLELTADRPPMPQRRSNRDLVRELEDVARTWEVPFKTESSTWPSVVGLVPPATPALCGLGPVAENLMTPQESVSRISLVQRTLLLVGHLLRQPAAAKAVASRPAERGSTGS